MNLIYLSPVPWDSFSQRPHECVRYFHLRTGGRVFWVDPYPTRFPVLADVLHRRPQLRCTGSDTPAWLTLAKPKAIPFEPLPFSGLFNQLLWRNIISEIERVADKSTTLFGIGKPSLLALKLLSTNFFRASFYDAMDDFPAFYTGRSQSSTMKCEHQIVQRASTVLTSSTSLRTRLQYMAHDVRLVPNACASNRLPVLTDRKRTSSDSTFVIGYVGTMARWFDWKLLAVLAESCPNALFRLIGPIYGGIPVSLPENVQMEPPRPHDEVLKTMAEFDVGLIPFKRTNLTSSVDPIKYYEYRALGLPVVSSAFGEMARRGESDGVFLINRNSAGTDILQRAREFVAPPEMTEQFRLNNSWMKRFDDAKIFQIRSCR